MEFTAKEVTVCRVTFFMKELLHQMFGEKFLLRNLIVKLKLETSAMFAFESNLFVTDEMFLFLLPSLRR